MNAYGYPGSDGFLGTRAPLIMDVLCVAMLVVLIVLGWSVYQVKVHRRYTLHKWTQISLATILLILVILFEADVRMHGWQQRSAGQLGGHASATALATLYVHLVFAISTTILWPVTIVLALRNFANPALPGPHSKIHVPLARIAALDMLITSFTGWTFYWVAFVR